MRVELWAVALVFIGDIVGSFGPIFLKKGAKHITLTLNPIKAIKKNIHLLIGVSFYAFGTILFIPALKGGNLSVLYPMVALSYVCVTLYSRWLLKEPLSKMKWFGIALIIAGITLIGIGGV